MVHLQPSRQREQPKALSFSEIWPSLQAGQEIPMVLAVFFFLPLFIWLLVYLGLSCLTQDPHCIVWDLSLGRMDSLIGIQRLSSHSKWASLPSGTWDLSSLTRNQTHVLHRKADS